MDKFLRAKAAGILHLDEEADDPAADPPEIVHAYPLDYALSTWQDHQRDGSSWPEGTCYNDQDPTLMAAWDSFTARYNWWFDTLRREQKDADEYEAFRRQINPNNRPRQSLGSLVSD